MQNYKKQDGCHNCVYLFLKSEYDDFNEYYCHIDNSERPPCMSVAMCESNHTNGVTQHAVAYKKWDKWAKPREVQQYGICDSFLKVDFPTV